MRLVLTFLVLAGAGAAALLHWAGGLDGPKSDTPPPAVDRRPVQATPQGHLLDTGDNRPKIMGVEGISQPAPPKRIVWRDRLSDETVEIPVFTPWRFQARDAKGIQPTDADQQGVLCTAVRFQVFREPASRAEALALLRNESGAYDALLNQSFEADEARVFGRLGEALNRSSKRGGETLGDTKLILSGHVHITDRGQGIETFGEEVTVKPEQGHAVGHGPFEMRHEAFNLKGSGLTMERVKSKGWSRIAILKHPVLRIHSDVTGKNGKPAFDFGGGDFRPSHVTSEGQAILIREVSRRETAITITFTDRVRAEQQGGRSLDAGRVEFVATRDTVPAESTPRNGGSAPTLGTTASGWRLQHFRAEESVSVEYPGRTRKGRPYLASITADSLLHRVREGVGSTTELEGHPVIIMRGAIPMLGPEGRLRASARDSASIGPLRPGAPTGGLDASLLQQITLRGNARIARQTFEGTSLEDVLEGDDIDLVVLQEAPQGGSQSASRDGASKMVAIHFAALGNVRVGGTRIRGTTHRLVADGLHTERPHILAEGKGTRFLFPDLGREQRLLGPTDAPQANGSAGAAADAEEQPGKDGRWELHHVLARGTVDIDTSLGGPALGIPAHITGDEVSYDRISERSQVRSLGGGPVLLAWTLPSGQTNNIETRTLTLDQGQGLVTAEGGVDAEIYLARGGRRAGGRRSRADFGMIGVRGGQTAGSTLSVETDGRIEIDLVRILGTASPEPGKRQTIKISGPLVAEMKSADDRTVDRMRAQTLEIAMVYEPKDPEPEVGTAPSAPTTRVDDRGAAPITRPAPAQEFERVDIEAGEMRIGLSEGKVRRLEATGKVELRSKDGRVSGQRLTYDGLAHRVDVLANPADPIGRPAAAWLGVRDRSTEIKAARLSLTLRDETPARLEAEAPAGKTADIQLYRPDKEHPGRLEWFSLTYTGSIYLTASEMRTGRVKVVRRIREHPTAPWGAPTKLQALTLRVLGRNMLASEDKVRDIQRILAEGPKTYFRSGRGATLVEVWGHRFDFDVATQRAALTGIPGQDVFFRRAGLNSVQTKIVIDMKTNLPAYISGSRILWSPDTGR